MTDHPALDPEAIAESLRAASLDQIVAELARKARTFADMAHLLAMLAKHEDEQTRLEDYARRIGVHAEMARMCFEGCRGVLPDGHDARDALTAAREASDAALAARVLVAVCGARGARKKSVCG